MWKAAVPELWKAADLVSLRGVDGLAPIEPSGLCSRSVIHKVLKLELLPKKSFGLMPCMTASPFFELAKFAGVPVVDEVEDNLWDGYKCKRPLDLVDLEEMEGCLTLSVTVVMPAAAQEKQAEAIRGLRPVLDAHNLRMP